MKKLAFNIYKLIYIVMVLWFICSWFEVITHNTMPTDYTYSSLNLIKILTMLF